MEPYYNFIDEQSDIKSLIHLINFQGNDLVGLELGVFQAHSFCTVLQNCPNIKELHGVDNWLPHADCLKDPYDGTGRMIDLKDIKHVRLTALHNIDFSGYKEKAVIHEKNSDDAVNDFEDETFDFIFIDTYMNLEQAKRDLNLWYPKLKKNGLFTGHDWNCSVIQQAVNEYRRTNNIISTLSSFDNAWAWKK